MDRVQLAYDCSPLSLNHKDASLLATSEGFWILRHYLAEHCVDRSCTEHKFANQSIYQTWLLSRDMLHAIVVPIVELFNKAVSVAEQATSASNAEDYEYAFHGDARFAFVWLQSFLERERKWCLTHGCAACVVEHAFDSEFSLRLLFAACLLSDIEEPCTQAPSLPSFGFFTKYLAAALHEDELWNGEYIEQMQPKIIQLKESLEELMHQTSGLETMLNSSCQIADEEDVPGLCWSPGSPETRDEVPGMGVRRGKIAKRQKAMEREEQWWAEQELLLTDRSVDAQHRSVPIAS